MSGFPVKIERVEPNEILIHWNDGQQRLYTSGELRDACPCATCREKSSAQPTAPLLPVIGMNEAQPLTVTGMQPMGSYAYSIGFSDGHDTGIYSFELLRTLGKPV